MVIMHYSDKPHTIHMSRFAEKLDGFSSYKDALTDQTEPLKADLVLNPYEVRILELMK